MQFDWDPKKAAVNLKKHEITFEFATGVFADIHRIDETDDGDYDEVRRAAIGLVHGQVLIVIYTERDDKTRLISARRTNAHEEERYRSQMG